MKKILLLLLALFSIHSINAKQISENEAAEIARNFFKTNSSGGITKSDVRVSLAHEFKADEATLMYAFNTGNNGYVLVSGDDQIVPVLGYTENGLFDYNTLPDNARTWFDMYTKMIKSVKEGKTSTIKTYPSETSVEPLITSQWNQGYPYWNYTPQVNGEQSYTGCPATAMAQIAYYHKWPISSYGSVNYVTETNKIHISTELNTTFDWNNMIDTYNRNSSEESCHAVAQLMRDIGYAMEMDYTPDGSGQTQEYIARGIVNHLGYDKSLRIHYAGTYDPEDWTEMLKEELNARRPILYCGYTQQQEGHAFVCDGYDEEGLFHINWGWGGVSDGYFVITALDPEVQGAGGANSGAGFNKGQLAMMSIQKPVENSVAIPYTILYENGSMNITETTIDINLSGFLNGGYEAFEGSLCCDIISIDESLAMQLVLDQELECPVFVGGNYEISIPIETLISNLEDGTYAFYLYTVDANEVRAAVESFCDPFIIKKEGDDIVSLNSGELVPVKYSFNRSSASTEKSEYIFSFDLKNETSAEYNGNISVAYTGVADDSGLAKVSSTNGTTTPINICINPGETKTITIPSGELYNHMDYTLAINVDGIEVHDNKFEFHSGEYHPIEFRDAKVYRDNDKFVLKATIVNISGIGETYENIISCSIYPELSATEVSKIETNSITLAPFESTELSIPIDTDKLDFGEYRAILNYIKGEQLTRMAPEEQNAMPFVLSNLPNLSADNISLECVRMGESTNNYILSYDITNESDFYYEGNFQVKYTNGNSENMTSVVNVILPPGETVTITHEAEDIELLLEQKYQFEIIEEGFAPIEDNTFEYEVPEEHALEHRNGSINIDGDMANFRALIVNLYECEDENETMVYEGSIILEIYTSNDERVAAYSTSEITLESGQAVQLNLSLPINQLPTGSYYIELKCEDEEDLAIIYPSKAPEFFFEVNNDPVSIDNVDIDNPNRIVDVVSIDGRVIKKNVKASDASQGLAPGIYFIGNKKVFIK